MPLKVPVGDDAAVLGSGEVLTTDLLMEGVHFNERLSPADVGYKAVAVSVSDLAAMGARPTWMLLTLALGEDLPYAEALAQGIAEACEQWQISVVGGDTTGTPGPRVVGVALAGRCPGPVLTRSAGRVGDRLCLTGTPGLAARGYLDPTPPARALRALRRPAPRLAFALEAAPKLHAVMDLSDGLLHDLPRLCRASNVGITLDPSSLLRDPDLAGGRYDPRTLALCGGDDYELLFSAAPQALPELHELAHRHGIALHELGTFQADPSVTLTDGPWPSPPWSHHPTGGAR